VLRALLVGLQGGCVTLRRCDVAVADEAADAASAAEVLLHAGGVLRVNPVPCTPNYVVESPFARDLLASWCHIQYASSR
jgi:hypothetical protein